MTIGQPGSASAHRFRAFAQPYTALRARFRCLPLVAALVSCSGPQSALDPQGPAAAQTAWMIWLLFGMGAAVTALVLGALALALRRRRAEDAAASSDERAALRRVLLGGVALPTLVVVPLFFYTVVLQRRLLPADAAALTVEIEGHQWWWAVRYRVPDRPGPLIASANELHVPAGRRVRLVLTSTDVIHSFWVPSLQGKTDLIPGRRTVTWIQADRPGVYRGQCAEFCGLQHARMTFRVVAHEPADFDAWLAREQRPAASTVASATGEAVFLTRGCASCHTVRGTAAAGLIGPDLTHVASRGSLAGGILPNDRASLIAWITDPPALKPGSKMPRTALAPAELLAVVAYLESLR